MRNVRWSWLLALLFLLPLPARAQDSAPSGGAWPFGGATGPGAAAGDYYNLGVLGAKAWDADRPEPGAMASGMKQVKMEADPGADRGPDRLKVVILYPGGPAQEAGLRSGDVVLGVNGQPFKEGSLAPLAAAILKAEAGTAKDVALLVQRGGAGKTEVLRVKVPVLGKEALKPAVGKARDAHLRAALDWLAKRQREDGGFAETLSGTNGSAVQAAMAGLAWLAGGSDLRQGPHAANIAQAVEFLKGAVGPVEPGPSGGTPNWNQDNWGWAHAALFLGELQARSPDDGVRALLHDCATALAKRQEKSGGYAHGPGGPNALKYVELNIVTALACIGMGLAQQSGWKPPEGVVAGARKYLEDSSSGDGGIGYSTSPGQKGQGNIGRTAAAWLGYNALGLGRDPWTRKMGKWVERNAGDVFGGHASLMQHLLLDGVASRALGGAAWKAYLDAAEPSLVLARSPDGSFQPRPWHESLAMGSNSDVSFGEVWTTACWAVVLGCEAEKGGPAGLPALMGGR